MKIFRRFTGWAKGNEHDLLRIVTAVLVAGLLFGGINQWNQLKSQGQILEAQGNDIKTVQKSQGDLLQALKDSTEVLKKNQSAAAQAQSKFNLCLAEFFSRPDRDNLVVSEICTIEPIDNGGGNGTSTSPTPQTSQNSTSHDQNQNGNKPNQNPGSPGNPNTPPEPPENPPDPPVEVLGIPVCVPFTGLCVR